MNQPLPLTSQNYHSNEANQVYMSNSQYKDFMTCEAMAMAKIFEGWKEPESDALLIGSYVHAAIEGTLDEFKDAHPELFTKKGELYAKYEQANVMIATLKNDPFIDFVLQGEHEVTIVEEFAGTLWKAKLDVLKSNERIADIKTVKTLHEKHWDTKYGWVSFVEKFGYLRQMALYAELERIHAGRDSWLETLIVAVSKEDVPDKAVIGVDPERLQMELDEVKQNMPRILAVKNRIEKPHRCETCRYCRETKKVQRVIHYMDLLPA